MRDEMVHRVLQLGGEGQLAGALNANFTLLALAANAN
jgi:hypothetical protein